MDLEFEALSLANKEMETLHPDSQFISGVSPVPVTGKVFGSSEIHAAVSASLDFWLTSGPYTESFESRFAKVIGMRHAYMVNSGSSANAALVATDVAARCFLTKREVKGRENH